MAGTMSSNWKAMAPLIKKGYNSSKDQPAAASTTTAGPSEEDNDGRQGSTARKDLWFEVDEVAMARSEMECQKILKGDTLSLLDLFAVVPGRRSAAPAAKGGNPAKVKDVGRYLALDCEMVTVGPEAAPSDALARLSIVNFHGQIIMDQHIRPTGRVIDYRTAVSGILPKHLAGMPTLAQIQGDVWKILEGKVVIGHDLKHDFCALLHQHPKALTRDTALYAPFRALAGGKTPSLKLLAQHYLSVPIQGEMHDSVEDARAAMLLYRAHKVDWENDIFRNSQGSHGKQHGEARQDRRLQKRARAPTKAPSGAFGDDSD